MCKITGHFDADANANAEDADHTDNFDAADPAYDDAVALADNTDDADYADYADYADFADDEYPGLKEQPSFRHPTFVSVKVVFMGIHEKLLKS